jgi:hypothetical protein
MSDLLHGLSFVVEKKRDYDNPRRILLSVDLV